MMAETGENVQSNKESSHEDGTQSKEYVDRQDAGFLVLEQLQTMNRMLGLINQNITSILRKLGAQEVTVRDQRTPSVPYVPPSPGSNE